MTRSPLPRTRWMLLLIALLALGLGVSAFVGLRRGGAEGSQPASPVYGEARVNVSSLNLRTGPHVSYTAVAYLMDGEAVRLVGRNRAGTWAQIELYNGYRGWVNARYLQPGINLAALPVVDVALLGLTAFVTNDPIPMYAGPGAFYQPLGAAQPGESLTLTGRNDAATWVRVFRPTGHAGWVAADSAFLPSSSLNDLPIITPFHDAPGDLAAFYLVYAGPGFVYDSVANLIEGQSLGIRGRTDDARWVLVRLPDGREGWIAAEIVQATIPLESVPIIAGIAPPQAVGWQAAAGAASGASPATAISTTPTATATATSGSGSKGPVVIPPTTTPAASETPTAVATSEPTATVPRATVPRATTTRAAATSTPRATATDAPATATTEPTATAEPSATVTPVTTPVTTATNAPPTATGAPTLTEEELTPGIPVVYVYATPSEENAPILRVVPGQSVVLIGRTADSEWVQIWLPGDQQGWVRAEAIEVDIDLSVLPVVTP